MRLADMNIVFAGASFACLLACLLAFISSMGTKLDIFNRIRRSLPVVATAVAGQVECK
jgi:hypothetical protein